MHCVEKVPTSAFFGLTCLRNFDWNTFGLHDWISYDYKTGKLSRAGDWAPMVRELPDGSNEKIEKTGMTRLMYRDEFASPGILLKFKKPAWLQLIEGLME